MALYACALSKYVHDHGYRAEALRLVDPSARTAGVTTSVAAGLYDAEICAACDRQRLRQVLLNLLSNAIKYNNPGGKVTVDVQLLGPRVAICITDTGIGIPTSRLPQLFVPFERLGAENSPMVEGTGVGLALTKMLVEGMGGEIDFVSQPSVGSTFTVLLPSVEPDELAVRDNIDTARRPFDDSLKSLTVLCIEDNEANVRLIDAILAMFSIGTVMVASTAQRGIELALMHQPDIVLLDLHLPDLSGEFVLHELLRDPRTSASKVIVITADANPDTERRLLAAGASRYLTKPVNVRLLFEALSNASK